MNDPLTLQYPAVGFHKPCGGESLVDLLHLRVGEGDPYFRYLLLCEKVIDQLDMRTQKGDVCKLLIQCFCSPFPHACPLDVDADKVLIGIFAGQSHRVLSFAATQLQNDGMVVPEKAVPLALQVKPLFCQRCKRVLEHIVVGCHVGKFSQFVFCHENKIEKKCLPAVSLKRADHFYKNRHLCVKKRNLQNYHNRVGKDENERRNLSFTFTENRVSFL